tara:strand:- start:70114 stop:71133 length:1020 start_codon:yes stop_codon:yes gene_type:complete
MTTDKRKEMLKRVRERMLKKKGGRRRDPGEWRAPNLPPGDSELKLKTAILPPLSKGDVCAAGSAENDMEGLFFIRVGDHWINKKRFPCPRVYDYEECPYCQLGFDLMQETDDKDAKREIAKQYLPTTKYAVNIYFPNVKSNPEDLRGTTKWYAVPSTIFDKFDECINNDDEGDDPDDPQSFGLFYDENNAYSFQIHICKNGQFNDYKGSKFLVTSLGPIADSEEEIEKILAARHDLATKFPERTAENLEALTTMVKEILEADGDDDGDGFDADEQKESTAEDKPKPKPKPAKAKAEDKPKPKAAKPAKADRADAEETVLDLSDSDDEELNALVSEITNA